MKGNLQRWLEKEKGVKISSNEVCKKATSEGGDTRCDAIDPPGELNGVATVLVTSAPPNGGFVTVARRRPSFHSTTGRTHRRSAGTLLSAKND